MNRIGPGHDRDASIDALEEITRGQARRARNRARLGSAAAPLVSLITLLVVWELAVDVFHIPHYVLPPPSDIYSAFTAHAGRLLDNGIVTMIEIITGFSVALVIGIGIAVLLDTSPILSRALYPLLVGSQAVPKVAIAPILIVWLGFGLAPKVVVVFLMAFFPVAVGTLVGLSSVQQEQLLLARSMRMNRLTTFRKIRLPSALPSMFGGIKVAVTLAVVGAIVGEFVGADSGLGYLLRPPTGCLTPAFCSLAYWSSPRSVSSFSGWWN